MARLSHIVVVNVPHHVTQRGNARQFILAGDDERLVYLNLLRKYVQPHELSLLGYCLMSNHVHLLAVPRKPEALALSLSTRTDGTRRIGTPPTGPADMFGKAGFILVRWTATIGLACARRTAESGNRGEAAVEQSAGCPALGFGGRGF